MNVSGRVNAILQQAGLWAALGVACLTTALAGLGFLIAGFYIWVAHRTDPATAAAIAGGVLLVMAIVLLLIGGAVVRKMKKRQPGLLQEFSSTIGLGARLIALMVRKDPRKAMIVSIVAGALAEFIASERKK